MAIPTLDLNSGSAFRPTYQDYLSRSRQSEHDNRAKWAEAAKYFHNNQVTCIKNNQWGSENTFQHSLDTFAAAQYEDMQKVLVSLYLLYILMCHGSIAQSVRASC